MDTHYIYFRDERRRRRLGDGGEDEGGWHSQFECLEEPVEGWISQLPLDGMLVQPHHRNTT